MTILSWYSHTMYGPRDPETGGGALDHDSQLPRFLKLPAFSLMITIRDLA